MHKVDRTIISISFLPLLLVSLSLIIFKSILAAFFLYHIIICMIIPFFYLRKYPVKASKLAEILGLRFAKAKPGIIVGLGLGVIFFTTMVVFFQLFNTSLLSKEHIAALLTGWGYKTDYVLLLAVYFIFFNSVVEEIFWRGFLFHQYKKKTSKLMASILLSFFFIQYHFVTIWLLMSFEVAILFTAMLFLASLIWCYLRIRYDSLYPTIISHLFADLAIMFIYYQHILR